MTLKDTKRHSHSAIATSLCGIYRTTDRTRYPSHQISPLNITNTEWQSFMHCTAKTDAKTRSQCLPNFEDYMECLHHTKEKARLREIETVLKQKEQGLEAPAIKVIPVKAIGLVKE